MEKVSKDIPTIIFEFIEKIICEAIFIFLAWFSLG